MVKNSRWKTVHVFECPCGYQYNPEKGCAEAGYKAGTPFNELPEALTCPRCQRARVHFREKRFSIQEH